MSETFTIPKSYGISSSTGNVADVTHTGISYLWNGRDVSSLLTDAQKQAVRDRNMETVEGVAADWDDDEDEDDELWTEPVTNNAGTPLFDVFTPPVRTSLATVAKPAGSAAAGAGAGDTKINVWYVVAGVVVLYAVIKMFFKR